MKTRFEMSGPEMAEAIAEWLVKRGAYVPAPGSRPYVHRWHNPDGTTTVEIEDGK
jgi:hypothetical protein